ncbi:MAG: hypothetical protein QXD77_03300 [Candidatus Aenigmatarchaeota archaeon]
MDERTIDNGPVNINHDRHPGFFIDIITDRLRRTGKADVIVHVAYEALARNVLESLERYGVRVDSETLRTQSNLKGGRTMVRQLLLRPNIDFERLWRKNPEGAP